MISTISLASPLDRALKSLPQDPSIADCKRVQGEIREACGRIIKMLQLRRAQQELPLRLYGNRLENRAELEDVLADIDDAIQRVRDQRDRLVDHLQNRIDTGEALGEEFLELAGLA